MSEEQDMSEGFDLGSLLDSATQMQQQMMAAQQAAAEEVVDGVAGGGAVTVRVNGAFEFQSVEIDPAVVDPDDVEMLQDLVLAATRDALDVSRNSADSSWISRSIATGEPALEPFG